MEDVMTPKHLDPDTFEATDDVVNTDLALPKFSNSQLELGLELNMSKELFQKALNKFSGSPKLIFDFLNIAMAMKYEKRSILVISIKGTYIRKRVYHVIERDEVQKYEHMVNNFYGMGLSKMVKSDDDISGLKIIHRNECDLRYDYIRDGDDNIYPATSAILAKLSLLPIHPSELIVEGWRNRWAMDMELWDKNKDHTTFLADEEDVMELMPFIDVEDTTDFTYSGVTCKIGAGRGRKWYLYTEKGYGEPIRDMLVQYTGGSTEPQLLVD